MRTDILSTTTLICLAATTGGALADTMNFESHELSWQTTSTAVSEVLRVPQFDVMDGDRHLVAVSVEATTEISMAVSVENAQPEWIEPVTASLLGAVAIQGSGLLTTCALSDLHTSDDLAPDDGHPRQGADYVDFGRLSASCFEHDFLFLKEVVSPWIGDDFAPVQFDAIYAADILGLHSAATIDLDDPQAEVRLIVTYQWQSRACPWDCSPPDAPDNVVNIDDVLMILTHLGSETPACDVTPLFSDGQIGDGLVTIDDMLATLSNLGACP